MTTILPAADSVPSHVLRDNGHGGIDVVETATGRRVSSNWTDHEDAESALTLYLRP